MLWASKPRRRFRTHLTTISSPTTAEAAMDAAEEGRPASIYKVSRRIKRCHNASLDNAHLWPDLPLVANLRCGLWYSPIFHSTSYFKSTDGHCNNWSFNTSRLNLHLALLAGMFISLTSSFLSFVYVVGSICGLGTLMGSTEGGLYCCRFHSEGEEIS